MPIFTVLVEFGTSNSVYSCVRENRRFDEIKSGRKGRRFEALDFVKKNDCDLPAKPRLYIRKTFKSRAEPFVVVFGLPLLKFFEVSFFRK